MLRWRVVLYLGFISNRPTLAYPISSLRTTLSFFGEAKPNEAREIKKILEVYSKALGQFVNGHKSGIISSYGLNGNGKRDFSHILDFSIWVNQESTWVY